MSTAAAQPATGAQTTGAASVASAQDGAAMPAARAKVTAKKSGIGKASATFSWKGQNRTGKFKIYVNSPVSADHPARSPAAGSLLTTDAVGSHLARLLGHTRAAVLQALGSDCSTSELARRAGVSISSASEHAAVLRGAGLVSSTRQRNAVRHSLTPVGLALLDSRAAQAPGELSGRRR